MKGSLLLYNLKLKLFDFLPI